MSTRDDRYFHIAESIVNKWQGLLIEKGVIHGTLAYQDELVEIIEKELLELVGN